MFAYTVEPISYVDALPWLLKKHYARRVPQISFSFGLFEHRVLVGVCTFGKPGGANLSMGLLGGKFIERIYELNRLVLDGNKKNEASWFISRCFKMLPKPLAIVSFADSSQHHHGYIYQATNWIYTGLSAKRTEWVIEGMEHLHSKSIADKAKVGGNRWDRLRDEYGDRLGKRDRPRKHRYVYFLGSKTEKKEMRRLLAYDEQPYPKGDQQEYDSSAKVESQMRLF